MRACDMSTGMYRSSASSYCLSHSPDLLLVALQPRVLDVLGQRAQLVDVLAREVVELAVRLLGRGLHHERRVEELVQLGREELERQVRVLGEHVRGEVVVLVLAVEEHQVDEGLGREGRVRDEEVELFEAGGGLGLHVHQRLSCAARPGPAPPPRAAACRTAPPAPPRSSSSDTRWPPSG